MHKASKAIAVGVIGILLFVFAYGLALKLSDETIHFNYDTYADTRRDSSINIASLPTFMPKSARDIAGWKNVDANIEAWEFTFDPAELPELVKGFGNVSGTIGRSVEDKIRGIRWKVQPSQSPMATYKASRQGSGYLMIDERQSRAYYASEPKRP